ncbi:MAG: hypothetical protein PHC41_16100 [Lachnospiraceae bacterium]|nr:hypothetical protein [Lachnospiraceae bacterium]MDD3617712.1 hypothetical protein [Lachnospiraceae bacterium]
MKHDKKKIAIALLSIVIALISMFGITRVASSAKFHEKTIESLDEKQETVMKLTAASTATSAAITLIPTDVGNPIAEKIADLSTYFLIVLCAIFLEKYLVTITGYAAFGILIPLACVLFSINIFWNKETLHKLIVKLVLFGFAIFCVIPLSVGVSNLIEKTYEDSIEATISDAEDTTEEIQNNSEDENWLSQITSAVTNEVSKITQKIQDALNNFIEAIAIMIVTSCLIPILVLLFFVWLIKVILGIDVPLPNYAKKKKHTSGTTSGTAQS